MNARVGARATRTFFVMTCQQLVELVTAYFDGALAPAEREAFEAHLMVCPACHTYLDQMRATLDLAHGALEDRPEVAALLAEFRDWRRV